MEHRRRNGQARASLPYPLLHVEAWREMLGAVGTSKSSTPHQISIVGCRADPFPLPRFRAGALCALVSSGPTRPCPSVGAALDPHVRTAGLSLALRGSRASRSPRCRLQLLGWAGRAAWRREGSEQRAATRRAGVTQMRRHMIPQLRRQRGCQAGSRGPTRPALAGHRDRRAAADEGAQGERGLRVP